MRKILIAVIFLTACNSSDNEPFVMPQNEDKNGLVVIPGKVLFQGEEIKPGRIVIDITLTDTSYTYTIKTLSN